MAGKDLEKWAFVKRLLKSECSKREVQAPNLFIIPIANMLITILRTALFTKCLNGLFYGPVFNKTVITSGF